jgi:rhamnogalacturonan endolyase
MIDGRLRRVVMFPEDGHPDLAANVMDLTGDQCDEIVLWDQKRVWIYTQDRPFQGAKIYSPVRNPDYNESDYRTNVSLPHWESTRVRSAFPSSAPRSRPARTPQAGATAPVRPTARRPD